MAGVVSVSEKAGKTRQVSAGKTNASEPLMRCRKIRDVVETMLQLLAWEVVRKVPADCPSGVRHKDGVIPVRAPVRNMGTCRLDAKGEASSGRTARARVPKRGEGADGLVVVGKPGNAGGAKEPNFPAEDMGQPAMGGACA